MDDRAQPTARKLTANEGPAVEDDCESDGPEPRTEVESFGARTERMAFDVEIGDELDDGSAETRPLPGFDIDALRGWMLDSEDDDEVSIELGRDALDTIPLPPDELERLMVLTRGRTERLVTLMSAQPVGQRPPAATPIPATPRTMRGVEILLGASMEGDEGEGRAAVKSLRPSRRKVSRWTLAAMALAAALLPVIALGVRANILRGDAQADATAAETMTTFSAVAKNDRLTDLQVSEVRGTAFAEARAALARLRTGVLSCARETIDVLPGTSPPVPSSLRLAKGEGYASSPSDWGTPVWSCTGFTVPEPQRFQIQWQMTKANIEGMGVAWVDENEDGVPDRALGFRATLKDRGQPEASEIEAIDPEHPIARVVR